MKFTLASALLLISSLSFAAIETTQTLMPKAGQQELTPSLGFLGANIKGTVVGDDFTAKAGGYGLGVAYYYGLTDSGAVGVETSYSNTKNDFDRTSSGISSSSSTTSSGLDGLTLRYKGNFDLGGPTIYYSAGYNFGLEKSKTDHKSATETESNTAPEQPGVILQAAYLQPTSFAKLGALIEYQIRQKGESESQYPTGTTNYDVTGGGSTSLNLFAELENDFHPNLSLNYKRSYSTESKGGSSTSTTDGQETIGFDISGRMAFTPSVEFIPTFSYVTLKDKSSGPVDFSTYELYRVSAAARILF